MRTFITVLFSSLAISALIYAISSSNHLRLWLRYDGKIHLRVKLYLLEGLFLYDFMISGGEAVRMTKRERRLLSLLIGKKNKKQGKNKAFSLKFGDILQLMKKSRALWSLRMKLGAEDAAHTALVCGALMSFLKAGALFSLSFIPLQSQKISVLPVMQPCVNINFSCMLSIKTGHIIFGAAKTAVKSIKVKLSQMNNKPN
ncbi:MAG: hypothetical protein ACOX8S_06235 [Christensenellales bacterium]